MRVIRQTSPPSQRCGVDQLADGRPAPPKAGGAGQDPVIAVFTPYYPPAFRGGGPIRSVAAMSATAPTSLRPIIVTSDADLGETRPLPVKRNQWAPRGGVELYYLTVGSIVHYVRALREVRGRRPSIIHLNSFMNPTFAIVPVILWRLRFWGSADLLLSPRGEFGEGALARRKHKKRFYIRLFRRLGLHRRVLWHSTAPHETEQIYALWGRGSRVIERENDTLLPSCSSAPLGEHDGALRVVFLGRIVEHKGLSLLLEALAQVDTRVRVDVLGSPQDSAYFSACSAIAETLLDRHDVKFLGEVPPEDVLARLREHDVMVLPTAGENFGHVIAEALASACFVVTTPFTPWNATLRAGGGVVVARTAAALAGVIGELALETPSDRLRRRQEVATAYNAWRAKPTRPHLWALALSRSGRSSTSRCAAGDGGS